MGKGQPHSPSPASTCPAECHSGAEGTDNEAPAGRGSQQSPASGTHGAASLLQLSLHEAGSSSRAGHMSPFQWPRGTVTSSLSTSLSFSFLLCKLGSLLHLPHGFQAQGANGVLPPAPAPTNTGQCPGLPGTPHPAGAPHQQVAGPHWHMAMAGLLPPGSQEPHS